MNKLTKFNGISYVVPTDDTNKAIGKKHIAKRKMPLKEIVNESINLQFKDLFKSTKQYEFIIDKLRDEKKISDCTTSWIDHSNGSKKEMIVLLRILQSKGYYKSNKNITTLQILLVCNNTFGEDISPGYINHTPIDALNINYIEPAKDHIFN